MSNDLILLFNGLSCVYVTTIVTMNNDGLISICLPTYQRPKLLKEALESCFAQTYSNFEIVIGDDSKDDLSQELVQDIQKYSPFSIRYAHNRPGLGEVGNVNKLFDMAAGRRLLLLHDDDLLLPNALQDLDECWHKSPDISVAFGKQYLIAMDGRLMKDESESLNVDYFRTEQEEGVLPSAIKAGLLQQFPNDAYLVSTELARSVRYGAGFFSRVANDLEFGIRLMLRTPKLYFVNKYTAKCRITDVSASQGNPAGSEFIYSMIEDLGVSPSDEPARILALQRFAPVALKANAMQKKRRAALKIFMSSHYGARRRFSATGLYHLLLLFFPSLTSRLVSRLFKKRP